MDNCIAKRTKSNKFGATKLVKWKMANTVAYPNLTLENFIRIDSSEHPTTFIHLLEKKLSFLLGSSLATNKNNTETVHEDRRKAPFGSISSGPAAEWFDSLEAALTLDEKKNTAYCSIH